VDKTTHSTTPSPALATEDSATSTPTQVKELMTDEIMTMLPNQNFSEVVGMMANQSFRHTVVVDSDERVLGVISDRDVLRALSRTPDWSKKIVSEIMTRDSITTTPESAISAAVRLMLEKRINCLPVVGADGRVCGILTSTDLLKAYESIQLRFEATAT
jgi:CBS domain-containing protein